VAREARPFFTNWNALKQKTQKMFCKLTSYSNKRKKKRGKK
jgi:hypothetical protein